MLTLFDPSLTLPPVYDVAHPLGLVQALPFRFCTNDAYLSFCFSEYSQSFHELVSYILEVEPDNRPFVADIIQFIEVNFS